MKVLTEWRCSHRQWQSVPYGCHETRSVTACGIMMTSVIQQRGLRRYSGVLSAYLSEKLNLNEISHLESHIVSDGNNFAIFIFGIFIDATLQSSALVFGSQLITYMKTVISHTSMRNHPVIFKAESDHYIESNEECPTKTADYGEGMP